MPIKVFCPNGCVVRVPSNRAGKVVRCPECKAVIRVDQNKFSGKARIDKTGRIEAELNKLEQQLVESDPVSSPVSQNMEVPMLLPVDKNGAPNNGDGIDITPQSRLQIPTPILLKRRLDQGPRPEPIIVGKNDATEPDSGQVDETTLLTRRASSARTDRIVMARFFAACLCIAGLVNLGPSIYFWVQWSQSIESSTLPRWIYLQIFIAAIHFVYALFIVQIPDWSALRATGYAMLGFAIVFGIVSTGLLIGGGAGIVSSFLEIPFTLVSKATIWCVAMLCLSTLLCYVIGRESLNWQRIELLLDQILCGKTASGA